MGQVEGMNSFGIMLASCLFCLFVELSLCFAVVFTASDVFPRVDGEDATKCEVGIPIKVPKISLPPTLNLARKNILILVQKVGHGLVQTGLDLALDRVLLLANNTVCDAQERFALQA